MNKRWGVLFVLRIVDFLLLARRKALRPRDLSQIKNFLFLQYETPLGAAVNSTPVFEALKKTIPDARICVACSGMSLEVLKYNPHIDELVKTAHPRSRFLRTAWNFMMDVGLRERGFDCVITDCSNRQTRIALLAMASRAPVRLGFTHVTEIYDIVLNYDDRKSLLANNLSIINALGHGCVTDTEPAVYFSPGDVAEVEAFLEREGLGADKSIIAVATRTSGGYPEKRLWRGEMFAAVADHLQRTVGCRIVYVGTADDRPAIDEVRNLMSSESTSSAGRFSVPELAAFLCHCDLMLTLDAGVMHVARAVELPLVIISRPWQSPHEWLPVGLPRAIILGNSEIIDKCRANPTFVASDYIDEVAEDDVTAAVYEMLKRYPVSLDARRCRVMKRTVASKPL